MKKIRLIQDNGTFTFALLQPTQSTTSLSISKLELHNLGEFKSRTFSPQQLKQKLLEKELLGFAAEKIIITYETNRIKEFGNNLKLDHVSLRDVSAGYDIQSYEGNAQIFIEVKAVSISNY